MKEAASPTRPPLSIRNCSATPLELKLVERYAAPHVLRKEPGMYCLGLSKGHDNVTSIPTAPSLAAGAKTFSMQDVSVRIEPFTTQTAALDAPERLPLETLRLTFEAQGERYRIDVPSASSASQTFLPLVPRPTFNFTGVFVSDDLYLTIYSSANLNCWMQHLKDATPLSALSMPGTHNSPTYHRALPSVRCQAVGPRSQLDNGVRFFDVRVQPCSPSSDRLVLVHSVFPVALTGARYFRELLNHVYAFLDHNPSECLVMSVKREGVGGGTDARLGRILRDHYTTGSEAHRWYVDPTIPTLGQVRGKIILMRRFLIDEEMHHEHDGRGWAIDAENWADNTVCDTHGSVCVQDFYQVMASRNISQKIDFAKAHMERAAQCICHLPGITTDKEYPVPPQPFYLNFLSASNFWSKSCWPAEIARQLNPAIIKWLCCKHAQDGQGDGGTGIVVCDWVGAGGDWDLVRCIVGMNAKLMVREMSL